MRLLAFVALVASGCPHGDPTSPPAPPVPTGTATADAAPPAPPAADCEGARQKMVELGCPPPEDAFGGWVVECSGWPSAAVVTSCVLSPRTDTCLASRRCLGETL